MKKFFGAALLMTALSLGVTSTTMAQTSYKNAVGTRIDFGTGGTYVGVTGKHFFNPNNAAEAEVLFGTGVTLLGVAYQYHGNIPKADGLRWLAGVGPVLGFVKGGGTEFLIRPTLGFDYKVNKVPLNLGLDWRPYFSTRKGITERFTAPRFSVAVRYAF